MITNGDDERFQDRAQEYAAYLASPEGRLRADMAFANLREFLPPPHSDEQRHALDVGGGTGAAAVRLASLGYRVTQLDSSQAMLEIAKRTADQAGVADKVTLQNGDAAQLTRLFPTTSFDVVLCHNILEYVEEPGRVVHQAARVLRNASAILSIVVRNQAGEVLKAAIQAGDLGAAEANLTAEWGVESLYGGNVRLFTPNSLRSTLSRASLELIAERGIRVIADYLPPDISRDSEYGRILELERKLGSRPEYAGIARYTHCLARRMEPRHVARVEGSAS